MAHYSRRDRLQYAFDNTMSHGPIALIGWLAALSLLIILLFAVLLTLLGIAPEGSEPLSFVEVLWVNLMYMLDSGAVGGAVGWAFRVVMLIVTVGGIFVLSTLIGVLSSGIEGKLEALRKGRSRVIEEGHIVVLGWSQQIFPMLSELAIANENQPRARIVILGDHDKVEMEEAIRDMVGPTGRMRIVCRSGSPINLHDLDIVNLQQARSIIILSPEEEEPDSSVIKSILAITNQPNRRAAPYHIVAEIRDPKNVSVAKMVGGDEVELILVGDLISRIIAQTCRQAGLSVIYNDLLNYEGDEIYFHTEPSLVGQRFAETLLAYEDAAVIGVRPAGGVAQLTPPMDLVLQPGDELLLIAADDGAFRLTPLPANAVDAAAIRLRAPQPLLPERTLILGWNWRVPLIIQELDRYVAAGSVVTVVADVPEAESALADLTGAMQQQQVTLQVGDITDRRTLDELGVGTYDHVITLSYSDHLDAQRADARTLITLLHLRDMASRDGQRFSIVSEMLDQRNRALAEIARADDFIVSDRLVSLMLAQVAENKALNEVFGDLFDPEGAEVYLKPIEDYVILDTPLNFYTVVAAARERGEIAIGYRRQLDSSVAGPTYGVTLNPPKSTAVRFRAGDRIVVLAEE